MSHIFKCTHVAGVERAYDISYSQIYPLLSGSSSSGSLQLSCHTPQLLIKCLYSPYFSHQGLYIVTVNVSQGHISPTMTGL